jgi:predicted ribonuclease YlaK
LRDAIWSRDKDAVICEACAGSGKTTIALGTAIMLVEYGLYAGIIYQVAGGVYESRQGLLPGTLQQKSQPLFAPLYQAVARLGYDPERLIVSEDNMSAVKEGIAFITAQSNSYIRGTSFGEHDMPMIVILDEAQNYTLNDMRTAVTRVNDGSKLIVLGQQKQCDLKYAQDSGLPRLIEVFRQAEWCEICTLTHNYRGKISTLGDQL